jgi:hypothetical protein
LSEVFGGDAIIKKRWYSVLLFGLALIISVTLVSCPEESNGNGTGDGNGPPPPSPASFVLSNLSIEPPELSAGETATISVLVSNDGESQGSHDVILEINGVQEEVQSVTIAAGSNQIVTFEISGLDVGTFTVAVNGLAGDFTVLAVPPVEWVADGIINPSEYNQNRNYDNDNYQLYWTIDDQYIYMAMRAETNGWVAIGFNPEVRMKNADMVLGFVKDGETTIFDMFSTGDFGPHPPDSDLGGAFDILEFSGKEEGGFTTIEFKKALRTDDPFDSELTSGVNKIIWAYGSTDSSELRHARRGEDELEFTT